MTCQAVETLALESDSPEPATTYEAVVEDGSGGSEYVSFEAADGYEVLEQIAEIEATVGPVTEVGEQVEVGLLQVNPSDDPRYGGVPLAGGQQKTGLDQAKFNEAWSSGEDGAEITVAVVDTGVDGSHVDLAGNLLPGADFVSPSGGTCVDEYGHGTHVAGIVGQVDNATGGIGGAPGVDILPVRVMDGNGFGSSEDVAAGIDWAVDHEADVINLSLGSLGPGTVIPTAVDNAVDQGVTVIAAAGNCGVNPSPQQCGGVLNAKTYPAALPEVIAVGALNTGLTTRASFSNDNDYIDIAAPGTNIDSTVPGSEYDDKSGTSMATPFVSAVAALLLRDCPTTLPADVLIALQSSATEVVGGFEDLLLELVDAGAAAATC
ncbi:MAG: S8 family peptidase [Acidimicrobiia bacterium]